MDGPKDAADLAAVRGGNTSGRQPVVRCSEADKRRVVARWGDRREAREDEQGR